METFGLLEATASLLTFVMDFFVKSISREFSSSTVMTSGAETEVFVEMAGVTVQFLLVLIMLLFDPLPTIWGPACKFFVASEAEAAAATTAAAVAAAEGVATLTVGGAPGTGGAMGVVGRCTDTGGCCEVTVAAGGC